MVLNKKFDLTNKTIIITGSAGLNTNLTLIAAGTVLIGTILLISAILLYSLVSVIREK
jgi:purine nucleoside permease